MRLVLVAVAVLFIGAVFMSEVAPEGGTFFAVMPGDKCPSFTDRDGDGVVDVSFFDYHTMPDSCWEQAPPGVRR